MPGRMKRALLRGAAAAALVLALSSAPARAADCADWSAGAFFEAATVGDAASCLAAGADPGARIEGGGTPLHWAAGVNDDPDVVAALVAAGADPGARDADGWTPLHAAASNGDPEVVTALAVAGADLEARTEDGRTPLHMAAALNRDPEVVAALLDAGADPKARDADGKLPFDHAVDNEALAGTAVHRRLRDARL